MRYHTLIGIQTLQDRCHLLETPIVYVEHLREKTVEPLKCNTLQSGTVEPPK